ncbi:MAG: hypothetical protein ACXWU9_16365 [Telluria sp.]
MITPHLRQAAAAVLAALVSSVALGQATIFRCGDSYSHAPCANAKALDLLAPPSDAQHAAARAVAARERQLALARVRDREERERAIRPASAVSLGPSPAAHAASRVGAKKPKGTKARAAVDPGERDFVAAVPGAKK